MTLAEIFKLCRDHGVDELKINKLHVKMGQSFFEDQVQPKPEFRNNIDPGFKDPLESPLTPEQVLFWSAGGAEYKNTQDEEVQVPLVGEEKINE